MEFCGKTAEVRPSRLWNMETQGCKHSAGSWAGQAWMAPSKAQAMPESRQKFLIQLRTICDVDSKETRGGNRWGHESQKSHQQQDRHCSRWIELFGLLEHQCPKFDSEGCPESTSSPTVMDACRCNGKLRYGSDASAHLQQGQVITGREELARKAPTKRQS